MAENKFKNEETVARCGPMNRLQSVIAAYGSEPSAAVVFCRTF